MSLWTNATLGVAAVMVCAGGAAAQTPGCAACNKARALAGAVPDRIPRCSKHDGLTQYPLSEKRYIKQFCAPTICPDSCFGYFKTRWTPWMQACPGWEADGVDPSAYGPNYNRYAPPAQAPAPQPAPAPKTDDPAAPKTDAPAAPKAEVPPPPSKPLEVPPAPMPQVPPLPPGGKLPDLPPGGGRF